MNSRLADQFRAMDTEELEERLASGVLTQEATVIAKQVLLERTQADELGAASGLRSKEEKTGLRVPAWFWLLVFVLSVQVVYRIIRNL